MFFSRVRSRCGRLPGRAFDFFTSRQNSRCSFLVRLCSTRSRPFAPSHNTTAQTMRHGTRFQTAGRARLAIQRGMRASGALVAPQHALDLVGDLLDAVLRRAGRLVDLALALEVVVASEAAGGLLHTPLGVVLVSYVITHLSPFVVFFSAARSSR